MIPQIENIQNMQSLKNIEHNHSLEFGINSTLFTHTLALKIRYIAPMFKLLTIVILFSISQSTALASSWYDGNGSGDSTGRYSVSKPSNRSKAFRDPAVPKTLRRFKFSFKTF